MPKVTLLYQEARKVWDRQRFDVEQMVRVECRRWKSVRHGYNDVVLDCMVLVDGEKIIDEQKCLDASKTNAELIRQAIEEFDRLFLSHPHNGSWSRY